MLALAGITNLSPTSSMSYRVDEWTLYPPVKRPLELLHPVFGRGGV
jgi:hypothetical protein